jgi:hypothetical protein
MQKAEDIIFRALRQIMKLMEVTLSAEYAESIGSLRIFFILMNFENGRQYKSVLKRNLGLKDFS